MRAHGMLVAELLVITLIVSAGGVLFLPWRTLVTASGIAFACGALAGWLLLRSSTSDVTASMQSMTAGSALKLLGLTGAYYLVRNEERLVAPALGMMLLDFLLYHLWASMRFSGAAAGKDDAATATAKDNGGAAHDFLDKREK